jgi:hypothetical protein
MPYALPIFFIVAKYSERSRDRDADALFLCYALNMEQLLNYKRSQVRLLAQLGDEVNE